MVILCKVLFALAVSSADHAPSVGEGFLRAAPQSISTSAALTAFSPGAFFEVEVDVEDVDANDGRGEKPPVPDFALLPVESCVFFSRALKVAWLSPVAEMLHASVLQGMSRGPPPL